MDMFLDFIKFATFGVTTEVVFTAICDLRNSIINKTTISKDLKGYSYIWMFPIYGSISFFAKLVFPLVENYPLILRSLIYGVLILIIEYITGFVIRAITGRCPWHYESRWAIHNLIRLDFLPFWMGFGVIVEFYYLAK